MVDLALSDDEKEIRSWVRTFVTKELLPSSPTRWPVSAAVSGVYRSRSCGALQGVAKQAGFFGIQTPEAYGGMGLSAVMTALVEIELGRSFLQFAFAGAADNILYDANEAQQEAYLRPTISGERKSCFAITEPGAGSDARAIRTSARREGDEWVINGEKTFITGGNEADFVMVFAVTDKAKGADGGVTCFLVDRDRGWTSEPIDTMGEWGPASLVFKDVRVPHDHILGEEGKGFSLAMKWIGRGRYLLPARALGAPSGWSRWPWSTPTTGPPSGSRSPTGRRSSG